MSTFSLPNDRLLAVTLSGEKVMARAGAMVAYDGQVRFEKSLTGGEGMFGMLRRAVANEKLELMVVSGSGTVYFADQAREVTVLNLDGDKLFIESSVLLAYEPQLRTSTAFAGLRGASSGQGLFTTTIEGTGAVAILSEGGCLAFEVGPGMPFFVDPDAYLGYTGELKQDFVFDVNWRTLAGQSSGESYQLKFTGTGTVFLQASERR